MNGYKKPRFIHDCTACIYLGEYGEYDCWFCPPREQNIVIGGDVILRYSSEGSEYASYDLSTAYRIALTTNEGVKAAPTFPALLAALRAVNERSLVRTTYSPREPEWTCSECGCDLSRWAPNHAATCSERGDPK